MSLPDDLTQPVEGFLAASGALRRPQQRARGLGSQHPRAAHRRGRHAAAAKRTACRRATWFWAIPRRATARRSLAEHFPAGSGSPVYVIVPEAGCRRRRRGARRQRRHRIGGRGLRGLADRSGIRRGEDGEAVYRRRTAGGRGPEHRRSSDGDVLLVGTLTDAADSAAAAETVRDLRVGLDEALGAGTAMVGGVTATDIDSNDTSIRDRDRDHPRRAAGDPRDPDAAAACDRRAGAADPERDPVVRRGAGRECARLQQCVRFPRSGSRGAAVRVRVPGRARRGLQHLPDVARARGVPRARHAPRHPARARRDGRCHHLGGPRAGGDVRRARRHPDPVPRAARVHRRVRRAARHVRGAITARARAVVRHRPRDLVAVAAVAEGRNATDAAPSGVERAQRDETPADAEPPVVERAHPDEMPAELVAQDAVD